METVQNTVYLTADIGFIDVETVTVKSGELKLQWLKKYEKGDLYKLSVEPIGNITDYLGEERLNIYFYVTPDKIYRLWSYVIENREIIEFYNNDDLLMDILDTDEKLTGNGELVYCKEDVADDLEAGESGKHVVIYHEGNRITYSRTDIGETGNREFYESFVWEEGKGLVEYKSGYRMEAEILYIENIALKKF